MHGEEKALIPHTSTPAHFNSHRWHHLHAATLTPQLLNYNFFLQKLLFIFDLTFAIFYQESDSSFYWWRLRCSIFFYSWKLKWWVCSQDVDHVPTLYNKRCPHTLQFAVFCFSKTEFESTQISTTRSMTDPDKTAHYRTQNLVGYK